MNTIAINYQAALTLLLAVVLLHKIAHAIVQALPKLEYIRGSRFTSLHSREGTQCGRSKRHRPQSENVLDGNGTASGDAILNMCKQHGMHTTCKCAFIYRCTDEHSKDVILNMCEQHGIHTTCKCPFIYQRSDEHVMKKAPAPKSPCTCDSFGNELEHCEDVNAAVTLRLACNICCTQSSTVSSDVATDYVVINIDDLYERSVSSSSMTEEESEKRCSPQTGAQKDETDKISIKYQWLLMKEHSIYWRPSQSGLRRRRAPQLPLAVRCMASFGVYER